MVRFEINTTDDAQSSEDLNYLILLSVVKDLWNLLSNNNYYLSRQAGAASAENKYKNFYRSRVPLRFW